MSQIQLEKATAFIKIGRRGEARAILVSLLKAEPDNAAGWWLMANAVGDNEHKKRALQRVLQLRPGDQKAEAMLAKLDLPGAHNPFKDPDNPFVAAKQNREVGEFDDPFAGLEDDDDPFGELVTRPALSSNKTQSQSFTLNSQTQTVTKASSRQNTSWVVIGLVLVAVIAVVAGVVFVSNRNANNSDANSAANTFVETEFHCSENETGNIVREFDAGVVLRSTGDTWQGNIRTGQILLGYFSGEAGSSKVQHFAFNGEAGQWVVIEVTVFDQPIDPDIMVYDTQARRLAWCVNPDSAALAYMELLLPATGEYIIAVSEFYNIEGTYELSLQER